MGTDFNQCNKITFRHNTIFNYFRLFSPLLLIPNFKTSSSIFILHSSLFSIHAKCNSTTATNSCWLWIQLKHFRFRAPKHSTFRSHPKTPEDQKNGNEKIIFERIICMHSIVALERCTLVSCWLRTIISIQLHSPQSTKYERREYDGNNQQQKKKWNKKHRYIHHRRPK